jgi:hypothetical protein
MSRPLTKFEELILNSPTCLLWPDCACYGNIVRWQRELKDEQQLWEPEQLEWAEEHIYCTCACVAEHCPDPVTKAYCKEQFANLLARRQRIYLAQLRAQPRRA